MEQEKEHPEIPGTPPELTNGRRDPTLLRVAELGMIGIAIVCIVGGLLMEGMGHPALPVVWSIATSCVWAIIHLIQSRTK